MSMEVLSKYKNVSKYELYNIYVRQSMPINDQYAAGGGRDRPWKWQVAPWLVESYKTVFLGSWASMATGYGAWMRARWLRGLSGTP